MSCETFLDAAKHQKSSQIKVVKTSVVLLKIPQKNTQSVHVLTDHNITQNIIHETVVDVPVTL